MNTVFILAAGSAKRFGGVVKQALPINGEPIIRRTIRQIREFDNTLPIYIVTWYKELMYDDVGIIDTVARPEQLQNTILLTEPHWTEQNILLLGDVVWDKNDLDRVLSYRGFPMLFASDTDMNKDHHERFALAFDNRNANQIADLCRKSLNIQWVDDWVDRGGLCKLCYATYPDLAIPLLSPVKINKLLRPFRDYFIYHVYPNSWKPTDPLSLTMFEGTITTDVDTEGSYQRIVRML